MQLDRNLNGNGLGKYALLNVRRMTAKMSPEVQAAILGRIPLGRMGSPDEVAQVVRFLAVEASYITGTVIHVNGGMYGG